jgi:hypothetical protein
VFPHKELQERVLPGIYFLARYGPELITELKRRRRYSVRDTRL